MILRCENCKTMYMFTEAQLKSQDYRFACKKCGHENTVALPSDAGGKEQAATPVPDETRPSDVPGQVPQGGPQAPAPKEAPQEMSEVAQEALLKDMPEELPKEAKEGPPPQHGVAAHEHVGEELEDIFSSLDTPKTDEKQPAPVEETASAPGHPEGAAQPPGSEAAGTGPPGKDEDIIEGFEEFTMDDLKGADKDHAGTHGVPVDAGPPQTDWLQSAKIDETNEGTGEGGPPDETLPMENAIPEMLRDDETAAPGIHEAVPEVLPGTQAAEHSMLTEETSVIPETLPASEGLFEETQEVVPAYRGHLMKLLIAAGAGILVIVVALLGIYYYLVEYTPSRPDFNKLALMTYSVFPVSGRAKDQAQGILKDADSLYLKDTAHAYRRSLELYEKAASIDHRLTGAYVGIAKDYAVLKDIDNTGEQLKDSGRFLSRIGSLLHHDAEYDLLQGMIALANDDLSGAADRIRDALRKSPGLPEAMYYEAYLDFRQGGALTDTASILSQAITLDPAMTKARLLLAKVYRQQHDYPRAIELLDGILSGQPYNTSAAILKAELETDTASEVRQSIDRLNDVMAKGTREIDAYDGARVYSEIGRLEMIDNDYGAAIDAFKASIRSHPTTGAYIAMGDAYLKGGSLADAEKQYQTAVSSDSGSAEARFRLAHAYYLDHRYVLAISSYTDGLRLQSDSPQALYGLSLAREKNGELDVALDVAGRAVRLSPDNPEFIVLDGRLLREKGDYRDASDILSKAVEKFPDYAPLHTEYGVVLGDTGDYAGAIRQLTTAMQISPAAADTYAYMADMLERTGKYPEAERYALRALSGTNNFPYAYEVLGDVYLNEQRLNDAIKSYDTAISLLPYNAEVQYKLARAYIAGRMFTDAAASLAAAIKLSPGNALYHDALGNVYRNMGNIQSAIDEYTRALGADSTMADAYYWRGMMNIAGRNDLAAVNDLKNAIKYAPNNPDYMLAIANYYYDNKETFSAIAYLEDALKIAPKNPKLHYRLGVAYNYIGKIEEAKGEFATSLSLSPHYAKAMIGLGGIYYQQGDIQKALQYYEKAVRSSPQDGDAHYALGTVYEYNGMYEKALAEYQEAVRLSGSPAAYFKTGMMLSNLNESDKAKAALLKAISLGLPADMESAAKDKLRNLM
ncbi:MAG: tetratricopeptide repeat protein [Deltaproteobacteria bacterium]|nr:tetratricopeptide repeat protein [Deltaproteobacteria bacterium]